VLGLSRRLLKVVSQAVCHSSEAEGALDGDRGISAQRNGGGDGGIQGGRVHVLDLARSGGGADRRAQSPPFGQVGVVLVFLQWTKYYKNCTELLVFHCMPVRIGFSVDGFSLFFTISNSCEGVT